MVKQLINFFLDHLTWTDPKRRYKRELKIQTLKLEDLGVKKRVCELFGKMSRETRYQ